MAINNRYLDFVQMHGLISLVNNNHIDNNLKEILVYVYFGLIVSNQPKNGCLYVAVQMAVSKTFKSISAGAG